MFKFIVLACSVLTAVAFNPLGSATVSRIQMSSGKKMIGAALIASTMIGMPVLAVEGTAAKIGIFTNAELSSPFSDETREDKFFSPYSPYGNGDAAVYKKVKGSAEQLNGYKKIFDESVKRIENVPSYVSKKAWSEVTTELTRYVYSLRSATLSLAEASSSPAAALDAAKIYFQDLNDISEFATKKKGDYVLSAYQKSLTDLASLKALLK
eukprot:gene5429-7520_t